MPNQAHSCVVIGAGLAGLAAAFRLTQKRWTVTLLEAQSRLGGRVLSHRFAKARQLVRELGGEWIGADHDEMRRLCCLFELELQEHKYSYAFAGRKNRLTLIRPGEWCFSPQSHKRFESFRQDFKNYTQTEIRHLDKLDWWTKLTLMKFKPQELLKRDLMDSTDFGESIRHTSAYVAATEYLGGSMVPTNDTDEMDFKIKGGNDRLVRALANAIGRKNFRTGYDVSKIKQKGTGVEVYGKRKRKITADKCVCALPAHCLRRIQWDPPLPARQLLRASPGSLPHLHTAPRDKIVGCELCRAGDDVMAGLAVP